MLCDDYKSCDSFYISALVKYKKLNKESCFKRMYYKLLLKIITCCACCVEKPDYAEDAAAYVTDNGLSNEALKVLYTHTWIVRSEAKKYTDFYLFAQGTELLLHSGCITDRINPDNTIPEATEEVAKTGY